MKRRLLFFVLFVLFAWSSSYAAELNIYASGLRLNGETPVTGENQVHIDYFLNAPASELKFLVLDASTGDELTSVTIPAGTSNANYTKGAHTNVVVDLSGFYGNDETYKWAIKAKAANKNALTLVSNAESFYATRGVAINNFPETENFGNIYISQCTSGTSNSIAKTKGIFVYNPAITCLNPTATTGIKDATWVADGAGSSAVGSPHRVTIAEDGEVYISCSKAPTGVWKLPDGDPLQSLVKVVDGGTPYGLCVTGTGSSRKLYTLDGIAYSSGCVGNILSYAIGNNSLPYTGGSTTFKTASSVSLGNAHCDIESDKKGGFWMTQNRGTDATGLSILSHLTSNGTKNYNSSAGSLSLSNSTRGVVAVNKDGSQVATCSGGAVKVFTVNFSGATPSLSLAYTAPASGTIGTNIDGLAFDYANNLYVVSSTSERLHIYAPAASNTCTTPAASSRTIVLGSYIPPTPVTGVGLNETTKTLVKGQNFTLTATIAPDDATNKNVTWESSDPTVASVSNGVVTALKKGTATITVKSADNETITASCDVTVNLLHGTYNIGGASAHYASLSAAASEIRTIGIDGDVTLLVCDDIAENANIGLINNTDYSITIRPNAATKRIITFGDTPDNAGPSGHLMIGYDLAGWASTDTKNIIIDGSYNGEGQYLEFQAGTQGGVVVVFYGKVTDSEVRNCRLINGRTTNTNYVAHFRTEKDSDKAPIGVGFDNCYMQVTDVANAQAVYFNGSQSSTSAGKPKDCYLRGCEIVANLRCVFFNGAIGATFEGNTFRMPGSSSGYLAHCIMGNAQSGEIIVRNNKFIENVSLNVTDVSGSSHASYGLQAVTASGGASVWVIENNYFAGMDLAAAGVVGKNVRHDYIYCGDSCVISHNTFYMPSLTYKPATALVGNEAITCVWLANAKKHHVKNNIFVSAETEANNSLIRGALNDNVLNNVFYHNGGYCAIVAGADTKTDWEAFTANGANAGSKWAEPVFSNAATGDLGIVEANDDLKVARLNDILTDLFGNDRNDPTYAGACEPVGVTNITGIPATKTLDEIGDSYAFTATVLPTNTSFPTITWTSNNEAAVTVTSSGVITAQGQGEATITATAGGFSVTCVVTVTAAHSLAGEYRIGGANADYTTLHAACADLCEYGLVGDATFLICADLSETANSGIVNNSDYTLTIRPDGNTKRTITFNNSADNKGPSGNMMIGCTNATLVSTDATQQWLSNDTRNIIIDGSYNGEGQYLEFKGGNVGGVIAVFYGNVTNSVIRNCRFISTRTTKTAYIAHFRTQKESDRKPVGVGFENCYMESTKTAETQVVYFNGSQSSTATGKPTNCYLRGCEIVSNLRGVFFNGAINATIEGNTFRMPSASSGYLTHAIMGNAQTGIITVRENKFTELKTTNTSAGSYGIRAITAAGGATKWVIENNYFDGLDATDASAAGKNMLLTYIWCSDLCEIRHNTFHMPSLTNKPSTTLDSNDPIACIRITGTKAHIIQNNLFVSEETAAYNSLISGTLPSAVSGNVFYHAGTNAAVTPSATTIDDLAATYKENNKWQQVAFSETYKPAAAYTGNINLIVAQIEGIDHDIEGNERGDITHVGCYEYPLALTFAETSDANTEILDMIDGITADVTLQRTFSADVPWYTLVLPFDVSAEQMQAIFGSGYRVAKLEDAYMKTANALLLRFADHTAIEAGVPCLFHTGQDINEDIVFHNVTIDAADPDYTRGVVTLHGLYDQTTVEADEANFYLGTGSYLYPYSTDILTNAFRAYFDLSAIPNPSSCSARIVFQEDAATELDETIAPEDNTVQKVIRDGQLIIIRNGQEYTIDGRLREVR